MRDKDAVHTEVEDLSTHSNVIQRDRTTRVPFTDRERQWHYLHRGRKTKIHVWKDKDNIHREGKGVKDTGEGGEREATQLRPVSL